MGSYSIRNVGIVNELDRMEKDMQFMKSRQFVGKRTLATKVSKAGYMVLSEDAWFADPVGPPQLQAIQREVVFQADSQLNPWGTIIVEFYDLSGNLMTTLSSPRGTLTTDYPGIHAVKNEVPQVDDGRLTWTVEIQGPPSPKFYVRWVVAGTDSGIIGTSDTLIEY